MKTMSKRSIAEKHQVYEEHINHLKKGKDYSSHTCQIDTSPLSVLSFILMSVSAGCLFATIIMGVSKMFD
mgnify:CR=1 FL=1